MVKIADEIIHAVPTQSLLLATDDAHDESGVIADANESTTEEDGGDVDAAVATVAMLEAMDEVKEVGDAKDMIWDTTLLWLADFDKMDDGSDANAAMYSKRIKRVKTVGFEFSTLVF